MTEKAKELGNESAFPFELDYSGLTKREYFAGQVLNGWISAFNTKASNDTEIQHIVKKAVLIKVAIFL